MAASEPTATQFKESGDGIGHMLVVPYYTVQSGNVTLLNIVNSDRVNGKAVKVRYRGASNADDVFNFTLFLSPGDVWAAEVNQNPTTGRARLTTPDDSCTLPSNINQDFSTIRLNTAWDVVNESREGYIDIITMADVVPGTPVYTATTHDDNGKLPAACSQGAATPAALQAVLTTDGINAAGLGAPTTGLLANWSILNVADATSWSGSAAAIVAVDDKGVASKGRVVVFPQTGDAPATPVSDLTSDPLLRTGVIAARQADFPDLSTPYLVGATAVQQASLLSAALAKSSVRNEYFIDELVNAATDWVMTMPTRRYSVAENYSTDEPVYTQLSNDYFSTANTFYYYSDQNTEYRGVCVSGTPDSYWDRSGKSMASDISNGEVNIFEQEMVMCGAVSTFHLAGGTKESEAVLKSSVVHASRFVNRPAAGAGWGEVQTPGIYKAGLPIVGAAFAKATSPNIGSGISGNFGLMWPHRYTRPGL